MQLTVQTLLYEEEVTRLPVVILAFKTSFFHFWNDTPCELVWRAKSSVFQRSAQFLAFCKRLLQDICVTVVTVLLSPLPHPAPPPMHSAVPQSGVVRLSFPWRALKNGAGHVSAVVLGLLG